MFVLAANHSRLDCLASQSRNSNDEIAAAAPRTVNNANSFLFCAWIPFIRAYYSRTAGEKVFLSIFSSSSLRCLGGILYSPAPIRERPEKDASTYASTMSQANGERRYRSSLDTLQRLGKKLTATIGLKETRVLSFYASILVQVPMGILRTYRQNRVYTFHYFSYVLHPHLLIETRSSPPPLGLALPRDLSSDSSFSSYQPLNFTTSS
ncbi:hypothetical protein EV127DRAFT_41737 [Xylaria flabelliformis]|nr:hypothetical protein EV127DRAFT_41737 [Xylaria flabelliformis]